MFTARTHVRFRAQAFVIVASTVGLVLAAMGPASAVTTDLPLNVDRSYQTNGRVDAILTIGDTVYLGGAFTSVRPAGAPLGTGQVTRQHLAALSRSTGALLPWNPGTDKEVYNLAASLDDQTVYIVGAFARLGGQSRGRLGAVDATSGALLPWAPRADLQVNAIAVTSTLIYFGGTFDTVNGVPRTRLAAVDYSGALSTTWVPTADNRVRAISPSPDGLSLFLGGDFASINGSTTQKNLARVSPVDGSALPWKNHPGYPIYGIQYTGTLVLAGGNGSGGHVGAFNLGTGALVWTLQTDGGVQAIAMMNGVLYVGGHFDNLCVGVTDGVTSGFHCPTSKAVRHKLLALDPVTGATDPWNPGANSPLGVYALTPSGDGTSLSVGGDFTKIGHPDQLSQANYPQQSYGQFTAAPSP